MKVYSNFWNPESLKHFENKPDNIVKTYSTAGGLKREVK